MTSHCTASYAYRGDRERTRRRARRVLLAAGLTTTFAILAHHPAPTVAAAAPAHKPLAALVRGRRLAAPAPFAERNVARENAGMSQRLRHWHRVYRLAGHYGVSPDLAATIHDIALAEGIEPDLGFRLVRAESEFNERATSPVGAVGLTQVMPGTARHYVRGVSRRHLYDRRLNLHVGFRYLRGLIREYKSLRLALLVYNRGPVAVDAALKRGDDPANGYEEVVAKGYEGRGVVGR